MLPKDPHTEKIEIDPWIYLAPLIAGIAVGLIPMICILTAPDFKEGSRLMVVLIVLLAAKLYSVYLDCKRIHHHIRLHGGRLFSIKWASLQPGWKALTADYVVEYLDERGKRQVRYCRTGILEGVYFRED